MGDRGPGHNCSVRCCARDDLSTEDTAWAMSEIMSGSATPAQIAAFAVALRAKGETPAEIAGLVEAMLEHAGAASTSRATRSTSSAPVATGPTR